MNESGKKALFSDPVHLRMALTLLCITGVVALLLGLVNGLTKDIIASIAGEKADNARKEVLPEASTFSSLEYENSIITHLSEGFDGRNQRVGFAVETAANGFGGAVKLMVGIRVRIDGSSYLLSISGVSILDISNETPGIGSKVASGSFISQFKGMTADTLGSEYDAVSGASYSSEGVRAGVEAALQLVTDMISQQGGIVK